MRDLVVQAFVTLDGVMQAPGGPEEDPTGGFAFGGWSVAHWDEMMGVTMGEAIIAPGDLVLGRKTYEIFAAHWPHVAADSPDGAMAEKLNSAKKYVASTTLDALEWHNAVLLGKDVVADVRALKQKDGPELQIQGSWELIQTLAAAGLIDEYRLWIFPVVVGKGKRVFGDDVASAGLTLSDHAVSSTGVIIATYRTAGPVPIGSFAFDEPTDAEVGRRDALEKENR